MKKEQIQEDHICSLCYFIGTQVGVKGMPSFDLGNCIECQSTKSLNNYKRLTGITYHGKQLYVLKSLDDKVCMG